MLYVVRDIWNTIYSVVDDGHVTKWDYIRRKNACSMCGKSYLAGLKNQARLHHTRFDPENPAVNTFEVCDDPGD